MVQRSESSSRATAATLIFSVACLWSLTPADVIALHLPEGEGWRWLLPSAPKTLTFGMLLALFGLTAWPEAAKRASRLLIQACVVLLGLRMDLAQLGRAAADGLGLAVGTIVFALAGGLLLARFWKTGREVGLLVSSGTAICGGSAIAAVGGAIAASSSSIAVATGAIFLLNAAGLYLLPPIGAWAGLSETQFGSWAGIALHDIASVAGAGKSAGPVALETAMVVKLVRVVWIAPIAIAAGWWMRRNARDSTGPGGPSSDRAAAIPWFIGWFVLASIVRTLIPSVGQAELAVKVVASSGFQLALLLIGAGLSKAALARVGWRAFALAASLWILLAAASLAVIKLTA